MLYINDESIVERYYITEHSRHGRRLTVGSRCSCSRKYFNLVLIPPAALRVFRPQDFLFLRSRRVVRMSSSGRCRIDSR